MHQWVMFISNYRLFVVHVLEHLTGIFFDLSRCCRAMWASFTRSILNEPPPSSSLSSYTVSSISGWCQTSSLVALAAGSIWKSDVICSRTRWYFITVPSITGWSITLWAMIAHSIRKSDVICSRTRWCWNTHPSIRGWSITPWALFAHSI